MNENVVDLAVRSRLAASVPVTDFWFAQVDARLSRIERIIRRLEWQVIMMISGIAALLLIEILRVWTHLY